MCVDDPYSVSAQLYCGGVAASRFFPALLAGVTSYRLGSDPNRGRDFSHVRERERSNSTHLSVARHVICGTHSTPGCQCRRSSSCLPENLNLQNMHDKLAISAHGSAKEDGAEVSGLGPRTQAGNLKGPHTQAAGTQRPPSASGVADTCGGVYGRSMTLRPLWHLVQLYSTILVLLGFTSSVGLSFNQRPNSLFSRRGAL